MTLLAFLFLLAALFFAVLFLATFDTYRDDR